MFIDFKAELKNNVVIVFAMLDGNAGKVHLETIAQNAGFIAFFPVSTCNGGCSIGWCNSLYIGRIF